MPRDPRTLYRFRGSIPPGPRNPIRDAATAVLDDDGVATLRIYDPIDSWGGEWGISAKEFAAALDQVPADASRIVLQINSPGGEVWEGLAIVNQLRRHPAPVTALIDGIAASAASFIACGGADQIIMGRNAQLMIHDAWGMCVGNAGDMRDLAERLDKISDNIASIYSDRAGGDTATWRAAMLEESWYNADEAVAAGLADTVEDAPQAAMDTRSFNLDGFRHAGRGDAPTPLAPVATAEEYDATRDPGRRLRDSKARFRRQ